MSQKVVLSRYQPFDFDEMADLARNYPCEFSKRRLELIEDAILNSRDGDKARRLQKILESNRIREWSYELAAAYYLKQLGLVLDAPEIK